MAVAADFHRDSLIPSHTVRRYVRFPDSTGRTVFILLHADYSIKMSREMGLFHLDATAPFRFI